MPDLVHSSMRVTFIEAKPRSKWFRVDRLPFSLYVLFPWVSILGGVSSFGRDGMALFS